MSKTLFNTNTFQAKTLQNSNTIDIADSNVENLTATNATITNLTNAELQAATSGVATNATAIAGNTTAIAGNTTTIAGNTTTIAGNTTAIAGNTTAIAGNATAIAGKQDIINDGSRLSATLIGNNGNVSNTEFGYLSLVTSDIQTQFNALQAKTTDMTYDGATSKTTFANNVHVTSALSTVNFSDVNQEIFDTKLTVTGHTTSIAGNTTATAGNTTAITTINQIIEGFTNDDRDTTTLDNQFVIAQNTKPQLIIQKGDAGGDCEMRIIGKRTGSTTSRHAKIDLQNDDTNLSPGVRTMASIVGRVSNHTTNVGGLEIVNYVDGTTATSALMMSNSGNFNIGGGTVFQDDFKMNIAGTLNVTSAIYQKPQMTIYSFAENVVESNLWGQGRKQTDLAGSARISGDSFSSHSGGRITISETGTYKIRVAANLQEVTYNDRLAFVNFLVHLNSSNAVITDFFLVNTHNFFSWLYIRNNSDGAHGNVTFEDYLYITSGEKIEVENKLDFNDTDFNDQLPVGSLKNYLNVTITKISDQNIYT